jgi:hypothetical protein
MIDAITSINGLHEQKDKIIEKIGDVEKEISNTQTGRTSLKSLINFRTDKEELLARYNGEKIEHINNLKYLEEIIKIVSNNLEKNIERFKGEKLHSYYVSLKQLADIQKRNSDDINEIWSTVSNDRNIKLLAERD